MLVCSLCDIYSSRLRQGLHRDKHSGIILRDVFFVDLLELEVSLTFYFILFLNRILLEPVIEWIYRDFEVYLLHTVMQNLSKRETLSKSVTETSHVSWCFFLHDPL